MRKIIDGIKNLWNIYGGILMSTLIAYINDFSKSSMDTTTSYIVLTLTCISVLTFLKITVFRKKSNGLIDKTALQQQSFKAMNVAVDPFRNGEEIGNVIVETTKIGKKVGSKMWIKIKAFFDKFKGYMLAIALFILSFVEQYGNYINELLDNKLIINGIDIISVVIATLSVVVACLSNGFTKDTWKKMVDLSKTLRGKKVENNEEVNSTLNTLLKEQLSDNKKSLKSKESLLAAIVKNGEVLDAEYEKLVEVYNAKVLLYEMPKPLATSDEVQKARNDYEDKHNEIAKNIQQQEQMKNEIDLVNKVIEQIKEKLK